MVCQYCFGIGGKHDCRCPLAPKSKFSHYCSICGEGIYDGEEYIENDDGEFAHLDCLIVRETVNFLGYDVKVMGSENDGY